MLCGEIDFLWTMSIRKLLRFPSTLGNHYRNVIEYKNQQFSNNRV